MSLVDIDTVGTNLGTNPVAHDEQWETYEVTQEWDDVEKYHHFHGKCRYSYVDSNIAGHYYCPHCGAKMDGGIEYA